MFKKTCILLLVLNMVVTLSVTYVFYTNTLKTDDQVEAEPTQEYLEFKKEAYTILGQLMMGMQMIDSNILRVHHFVEPHSDKFYEGCQECNKERKEMLQQQIPTDMKKLQQLKLPSEENYDTGK